MHPLQAEALALKKRMRNPPNGRVSTELEIVSEAVLSRRQRLAASFEAERKAAERRKTAIEYEVAEARRRAEEYRRSQEEWERRRREQTIPISEIIDACAERYGVSAVNIISAQRRKAFCHARQIAMYLCTILTTRSLPQIGRYIGDRDHTTVMHGRNRVQEMIEHNPEFAREIDDLKHTLLCKSDHTPSTSSVDKSVE
jgi:chromosomal replication initiation ATPase DnaA